ncbi:MAG: histidine phosphatase family protein [Candidatus Obscuribacterales bacterium]|nr:histidine phosphatase family protein [Candidatus Obscuribacterales bacterium]
MLKLFLLRHAKSSWANTNLDDLDRPLNERGELASLLMGRVMRKLKIEPDLVICSPSKRTRQTLALLLESAEIEPEINFEDKVYEASLGDLRKILSRQKTEHGVILMVGHNPGMSILLSDLTGEAEHFPTAALAGIDLDIDDWSEVAPGAGKLVFMKRPKELDENDY